MKRLESFDELEGHILRGFEATDEEIIFTIDDGQRYKLYHEQECCEEVYVEDICGDPKLMIGEKILMAHEASKRGKHNDDDTCTWTFYLLRTNTESVTIRFYGTSNGYYSESADFRMIKKDGSLWYYGDEDGEE